MRASILTYHFSDNYGALFQAYALREWLRRKGIRADFINYHPRYVEEGGDFDSLLKPNKIKKNLTIAYLKASNLAWSLKRRTAQRVAIDTFRREVMAIQGPRILTVQNMPDLSDTNLLICGSDQIWNPSLQKGLDPVYFLDIDKPLRARRISYAASFGTAELAPEYHKEAGRLIGRLDAISVREVSGIDIVRNVADREAICVPDPTILLGDFSDIVSGGPPGSGGHVFCYALRTAQGIREVAIHVGKRLGMEVLNPAGPRDRWLSIGARVRPGPQEWLQLLIGSHVVVTNSFHGVALSVVLNRPFIAVALPGRRLSMNERVVSLLGQLGLLDRLVQSIDPREVDAILRRAIDWSAVNMRLCILRGAGSQFLESEIAKAETCLHGY